jgi:hypothetical protein
MKTEISKIAKDLEQGTIADNEARTLLLGLLGVSESDLFHVEFAQKGSTYPMTAFTWMKDKEEIKREFNECQYDVLSIKRVYFH